MPVTGSVSNSLSASDQLSLTFSHTSNGDQLYVLMSYVGGVETPNNEIVSITFNSVPLTLIGFAVHAANSIAAYRLVAPGTHTANIVITLSAVHRITAAGLNLSGWPSGLGNIAFVAVGGNTSLAQQPGLTIRSAAGADVIDWLGWNFQTATTAAGSGQTQLWTQNGQNPGGGSGDLADQKSAGSLKAGASPSVSMSYVITTPSAELWAYAAISFIPALVPVTTPLAAQTPCVPQAQVTNGGKGKAGCNVGGIGGGHQYDVTGSPGVGSVPQHPDPDDGEILTGDLTRSTLEPWIELVHQDYPSLVKTTYRRAFEELADDGDYEGGRKESGVLAIGDIEHGLGNNQGGFEAGTSTLQLSDIRDRLFRELEEDQELDGDEYRVKLASDQARANHVAPRILQRGIVQQAALESTLQSRITGVDWLFSDFGPFGPGRKDPNWSFGDLGDAAPGMTNDTKAQAIPLLYGEKSDENATSPTGGSGGDFAKGLLPGYFLGRFDLTGFVPDPPDSVGKTLEQVVAELQASVDAHTTVADWSSIIGVADAIMLEAMGTVPNSYTGLANVIGYGDLDVLLSMGTTAPPAASEWGFIATGLGPWFQYTGVYGSNLGCGDALQTHDRVKLDPSTRADLLVPGVNWPFANPYLDLTNTETGRTFWLTGVFVTGPLLDDHLNGVVTMAFNAIGIEDVGDGSGLPIMRIEDAKQHRLENHWINQWSSGPYATTLVFPQFEDGTAMVRSSSFADRQQFFINQLGDDGILVSEYADAQQSPIDIVQQWNTDTESRLGVNQHGQIMDWGLDEFVDTSDWPRLDHVVDIFGPMVRTSGDERENVVSGSCDWDPDFEKERAGPFIYPSAEGIQKNKGRIRRRPEGPIESRILDNTAHFQWILQRRLTRLQFGLTMLEVSVPIDPWLNRDVGTGVLLNSEDGTGPNGYVNLPCIILRRRISLQSRLMTLTLWDVHDLLGSH